MAWLDEEPELNDDAPPGGETRRIGVLIAPSQAGERLDRALVLDAQAAADVSVDLVVPLSRSRIQALMREGMVSFGGKPVLDPSAKAKAGVYEILVPPPVAAEPEPEAIALAVLFEDAHLIVVDKPAGMAAHPAPGNETGTLVNALLAHCGASLSGIGGVARPGIVHRLDKDTSGVMVAAKTDAAHQGLATLFERHDIERVYIALTRGAPKATKDTVKTRIGRSQRDRKKMAVLKVGGREAVTHYAVEARFGPKERPLAARIACRLETGRTHQIRVHMAHIGAPCLGDPAYGSGAPAAAVKAAIEAAGLTRQALHASVLGFVHPITGEALRFETPPPPDMARLEAGLRDL